MPTYIAVARLAYLPLVNDDDPVVPSNLGALKKGLQALLKEDAEDDGRAEEKWMQAKQLLLDEQDGDSGGAMGAISVDDDFEMNSLSRCNGSAFY